MMTRIRMMGGFWAVLGRARESQTFNTSMYGLHPTRACQWLHLSTLCILIRAISMRVALLITMIVNTRRCE